MDIIIAGDGEVGFHIAKLLTDENHNIKVVDPHQEFLKLIESQSDLMTILGDSTSISVLEEAGAKNADLLIAVLHDERINLVSAMLAKQLGTKKVIARINNQDYLKPKNKELFLKMGIDSIVCPEKLASKEIIRLLNQSAATETFDFSDGKLSLFQIRVEPQAPVVNKTLIEISNSYPHLNFRAIAIHRNSETIIPKGQDFILPNDLTYILTKPEGIEDLLKLSGKKKIEIKNAMILGGGRIGRVSSKHLEDKLNIKLIDMDKERCHSLANELQDTLIINGDGRNVQLLEDEGIQGMDAFIAVTDNSETNIFTCLIAKKYGVTRTVALVDNNDYFDISHKIGIDTIINKKQITASHIVRFTMNAEVSSLKCLNAVDADVMEFVAGRNSIVTKRQIQKLKFPKGAIIGGIIRNNTGLIATGDIQIQPSDKVVVFSLPEAFHKVEKLFK